ncbi:MAG: DegT/DnrJ/EryC1/StrS family aminotransferase [Deltaproteobacteria bacterium]|nr:DegT/DnrJ/EryC1/StrS family aminotransferase [Deltaproteobacteria bacterium]
MIPQANPLAGYLGCKPQLDAALDRVLNSGRYILGDEVAAFEREFAQYIGVKYAVAVASGTDALFLALRACGVGPGDRVVTVSHTAVATVVAVEMCGALPVFADIDPRTYTLDPEALRQVLTEDTKALVPVHLYGQPAAMAPLLQTARACGVAVIEDCAQSHGALYRGRRVGAWGDAGAFSFYPTKNLGALGDGGAVTTDSDKIFERLLALRQYGWDENRISRSPGFNSRLDEIQAALLRVKLENLDGDNEKRRGIAGIYTRRLSCLPFTLPLPVPETTHVYHQYVLRCDRKGTRDALMSAMRNRGIQTAVHYPVPVHRQPHYLQRYGPGGRLPATLQAAETIVSLPMYPELLPEDAERVADAVVGFPGLTG